jgi:hypothetical protein
MTKSKKHPTQVTSTLKLGTQNIELLQIGQRKMFELGAIQEGYVITK